jgi:O-antigen ligase
MIDLTLSAPLGLPRAAARDTLAWWGGVGLLGALVFCNEANFRGANADEPGWHWQLALRLAICAGCGLYGVMFPPLQSRRVLGFPGAWCVLFAGWALVTAPLAVNVSYAVCGALSLGCLILFVPAVLERVGPRVVAATIVCSALAFLVACWGAQFTWPDLAEADADVGSVWRLGGLTHPNGTGAIAALAIGGLLALLAERKIAWRWGLIALGLAGATLLATGSRTSLAAALAVTALVAVRRIPLAVTAWALCAVAVAALAGEAIGISWRELLAGTARDEGIEELTSLTGRTDLWRFTLGEISKAPFWGYGFGCSRFIMSETDLFVTRDPHNVLLDVVLETGPLGGALLVAMLLGQAWKLIARPASSRRCLVTWPVIVTVLVVIGGTCEAFVFTPIPNAYTAAWLLALYWPVGQTPAGEVA